MPATIAASTSNAAVVPAQRTRALRFFRAWNFFGSARLPTSIAVKVRDRDAHAMFHFACAKIMQERSPMLVFFEVFSDMFGEQECVRRRRNPSPVAPC